MKSLILILATAFTLSTGIKYWDEDNTISWDDFKKVRSLPGNEAAKIQVATSSNFEYEDGYLKIEVRTYMDPKSSFVLKNEETDYLLLHEQIHFDIQEVCARKIRKRILEGTYKFNSLSKDLNKIIKEEMRECNKMQADYDKETNHSINEAAQAEWGDRVKALLEEYREYKDYTFKIAIGT